jgi:dTDP-4-dehydrorhamnose reductase
MKKKVLVTGASGFVGENFCRKYADTFEITGVYANNPVYIKNIKTIQADLTDNEKIQKLIKNILPDFVIHLAAVSDPNICEMNPEQSFKLNVKVTVNLAELCNKYKAKLVFASTDLVFDGKKPPYNESSVTNPVNIYGKHKLMAEEQVLKKAPGSVICRLPLMYGLAYNSGRGLLEPLLKNLEERIAVKLFTDEYRTPASVESICEGLVICMENGNGIFHLGGNERLSRYELGEMICEIFCLDKSLLTGVLQKDVKMAAERPANVSLISNKAKDYGWKPTNVKEDLKRMKALLLK